MKGITQGGDTRPHTFDRSNPPAIGVVLERDLNPVVRVGDLLVQFCQLVIVRFFHLMMLDHFVHSHFGRDKYNIELTYSFAN